PPRCPTPFPFTTLFRSFVLVSGLLDTRLVEAARVERNAQAQLPVVAGRLARGEPRRLPGHGRETGAFRLVVAGRQTQRRQAHGLDRKSTRLNSSHVKIS